MSRKQKVFQSVCMALIMSCCMSFVMTVKNIGFHSNLIAVWFPNAVLGFAVAIPLSFFVPSLIQKLMRSLGIN